MQGFWRVLAVLAICLSLAGCNIAGPAYPERNGRSYLEERGYPSQLVTRLIEGGALQAQEIADFQSSKSSDVGFLVARHPSLTTAQLARSIASSDDFVRSGAARNPNLSAAQVEQLGQDESHTVYSALAGNPALSEAQLLALHDSRDLDNLWFALNPNCPESIRQAILSSDDEVAQTWLRDIDQWKKDGVYRLGKDGRWQETSL